MSQTATLFRFRIELSDVDRGCYEPLDLRVAMHPSEALPYLLTRVFAYALNTQDGLEFSPGGLSDPDSPALSVPSAHGNRALWIEIGNPAARKLHKASKAAGKVKVFTYKDTETWLRELRAEQIHRASEIEIFAFPPRFLEAIGAKVEKDNRWILMRNDGVLSVSIGSHTEQGDLIRHTL
jgi:uncharacterized protein YaeQ